MTLKKTDVKERVCPLDKLIITDEQLALSENYQLLKKNLLKIKRLEKLVKWQRKDFFVWLNNWGDLSTDRLVSKNGRLTEYGEGYKSAIRDVLEKARRLNIVSKYHKKSVVKNKLLSDEVLEE